MPIGYHLSGVLLTYVFSSISRDLHQVRNDLTQSSRDVDFNIINGLYFIILLFAVFFLAVTHCVDETGTSQSFP